ncbi:MAG TPA: hypothetical protein VKZ53_04225 [Candidatus Angelobacter sp.]|nr:hypothetical protein [Candidatus Angelobacter sp.]
MRPLKNDEKKPFSDDPELVVYNFNRLAKAYLEAPQDPQSQEEAIGLVLEQIEKEKEQREKVAKSSEPDGTARAKRGPKFNHDLAGDSSQSNLQEREPENELGTSRDFKSESNLVRRLDELLEGETPIESLYGPPALNRPSTVLVSPGGISIIAVVSGFIPAHLMMLKSGDARRLLPEILKMADLLDEPDHSKAKKLVKDLERAIEAAGEEGVRLFAAPLFAWRYGILPTDYDDLNTAHPLPSDVSK